MQILLADTAGFCAGVKRAVAIAEEASQDNNRWYTLGPLVHNDAVVIYLKRKGITALKSIEDCHNDGIIIRTHGVAPQVIRELEEKGCRIRDATCPLVKRVQELAALLRGEGYEIVIFGDPDHPEVKGIMGWCDHKATVISTIDEAREFKRVAKLAILCQTTKSEKNYSDLVTILIPKAYELRAFNTICSSSKIRQEAALELCKEVDLMLVIGDNYSSNTKTLAQKCQNSGVKTLQIQSASDLRAELFAGVAKVGITAGASTPDWIIKEVVDKMTQFDDAVPQEQNPVVSQETEREDVQRELVEDVPQEAGTEENFARMEAEMADLASPGRGDVIKGIVIQVLDDEVMVDVGGKSEGIIPKRELSVKEISSAQELVKVGDEIEVLVLKWDDDGTILLSKKKVDSKRAMDKLEEDFKAGTQLEGTVTSSVKGGLLVDVGVVAFLPASHVEDGYVKNLDDYVGKTLQFKIIEFNRNKKRGSQIVLSRKQLVEEEKARLKEEFWANVEEGQTLKGRVKRIVDYGAFIDLGGFEGLLHVSELDHIRIAHPTDVLCEGEEIEVNVIGLDREKQRVSLSRKVLLKSPWEKVLEKFNEGDIIDGTVVRIAPFGAFVEIEPGVDGLVHISQLADRRVEKPQDVVEAGQQVKVKILSIDPEEKRVGLSIKEAAHEMEEGEVQEFLDNQEE